MKEFYSTIGGPTRFVDRLCGVLGIHASQVKIVSVYEGSLIINYELVVDDDSEEDLEALEKAQTAAYEQGDFEEAFGTPILDWNSAVSMAGSDDSVTNEVYVPVLVFN